MQVIFTSLTYVMHNAAQGGMITGTGHEHMSSFNTEGIECWDIVSMFREYCQNKADVIASAKAVGRYDWEEALKIWSKYTEGGTLKFDDNGDAYVLFVPGGCRNSRALDE